MSRSEQVLPLHGVVPVGSTRARAVAALRAAFAAAGLDTPALDARILASEALGLAALAFVTEPDVALDGDEVARLDGLARRRLGGEPVARILSRAEFWGLPFAVGPDTLVPRPDTETLVAEALACLAATPRPPRIADLGTGSGCILVAVLHERPDATGVGVDRSRAALSLASRNAAANRVGQRAVFALSDWSAALGGPFDCVVSNPPYIRRDAIPGLAREVSRFDPEAALDGGQDGLDAYRAILSDAGRILAPGGTLLLEIGFDQRDSVDLLARAHGYAPRGAALDLGGHVRTLSFGAADR